MNPLLFVLIGLSAGAPRGPSPAWQWTFDKGDGSGPSPARLQIDADLVNDVACGGRSVVVSPFSDAGVDLGVMPGQFRTRDFTVSLWMQTDTHRWNSEILSNRGDGSHGNFFNLRFSGKHDEWDGSVVFEVDENGAGLNYSVLMSPDRLNDGRWHHVVARRAGTTLSLFIDGREVVHQENRPVADIRNGLPLGVGWSAVSPAYDTYFDGTLDDIRIYDQAIPDGVIRAESAGRCRDLRSM